MSSFRAPPSRIPPTLPGVARKNIREYDIYTQRPCALPVYVGRVVVDISKTCPSGEREDLAYFEAMSKLGLRLAADQHVCIQRVDSCWERSVAEPTRQKRVDDTQKAAKLGHLVEA